MRTLQRVKTSALNSAGTPSNNCLPNGLAAGLLVVLETKVPGFEHERIFWTRTLAKHSIAILEGPTFESRTRALGEHLRTFGSNLIQEDAKKDPEARVYARNFLGELEAVRANPSFGTDTFENMPAIIEGIRKCKTGEELFGWWNAPYSTEQDKKGGYQLYAEGVSKPNVTLAINFAVILGQALGFNVIYTNYVPPNPQAKPVEGRPARPKPRVAPVDPVQGGYSGFTHATDPIDAPNLALVRTGAHWEAAVPQALFQPQESGLIESDQSASYPKTHEDNLHLAFLTATQQATFTQAFDGSQESDELTKYGKAFAAAYGVLEAERAAFVEKYTGRIQATHGILHALGAALFERHVNQRPDQLVNAGDSNSDLLSEGEFINLFVYAVQQQDIKFDRLQELQSLVSFYLLVKDIPYIDPRDEPKKAACQNYKTRQQSPLLAEPASPTDVSSGTPSSAEISPRPTNSPPSEKSASPVEPLSPAGASSDASSEDGNMGERRFTMRPPEPNFGSARVRLYGADEDAGAGAGAESRSQSDSSQTTAQSQPSSSRATPPSTPAAQQVLRDTTKKPDLDSEENEKAREVLYGQSPPSPRENSLQEWRKQQQTTIQAQYGRLFRVTEPITVTVMNNAPVQDPNDLQYVIANKTGVSVWRAHVQDEKGKTGVQFAAKPSAGKIDYKQCFTEIAKAAMADLCSRLGKDKLAGNELKITIRVNPPAHARECVAAFQRAGFTQITVSNPPTEAEEQREALAQTLQQIGAR